MTISAPPPLPQGALQHICPSLQDRWPPPPPRDVWYTPPGGKQGLVCRFLSFLKEIKGKTSMQACMSLFGACLHYAVLPNAVFAAGPG